MSWVGSWASETRGFVGSKPIREDTRATFTFSAPPPIQSDGPRGPEATAAKRLVSALNSYVFDTGAFAYAISEQGGIIQERIFETFRVLVHLYASWYADGRVPAGTRFYEYAACCYRFVKFMEEIENPVDLTGEDDTARL